MCSGARRAETDFQDRPFGGVLKVIIDEEKEFANRLIDLELEWSTERYMTGEALLDHFRELDPAGLVDSGGRLGAAATLEL